MATDSWTSTLLHTSDATFRDWGSELSTKLGSIGLVQTADTGQIDWVTVTRPGTNTDAGYEIWRFNDPLQSSAPIYIKLLYGTGGSASGPRLRFEVGTGSDGSGNLTGTILPVTNCTSNNSSAPTGTPPYFSTLCLVDGFFGLVFKYNAGISTGRAKMALTITRTVDENGDFTATGCYVTYPDTSGSIGDSQIARSFRFEAPAVVYNATTNITLIPGNENNSSVDGNIQAFLFWMITPQVRPVIGHCAVYAPELPQNTTFSTNLVGILPRTYISIGRQMGEVYNAVGSQNINTAMLWE